MDFILIIFIILALGCIAYSIFAYIRKASHKSHTNRFEFRKESNHIYFSYNDVSFIGQCHFEGIGDGLERRLAVKSIQIKLNGHVSELDGWTKNRLYDIEHQLYIHFPNAEIIWKPPMNAIIDDKK